MPQETRNAHTTFYAFVGRMLVSTFAIMLTAWLLRRGIRVDSIGAALATALVLALLDNLVRPALVVLALPFTLVSLGLSLFVINALLVLLASAVVPGFHVAGFGWAMLFSFVLTLVNYALEIPNRRANRNTYVPHNRRSSQDDQHFDDYEDVTDQEKLP